MFEYPHQLHNVIDTYLSPEENISPEEFLQRAQADKDSVRGAYFVAPSIGDDHFGYFKVKRKNRLYVAKD